MQHPSLMQRLPLHLALAALFTLSACGGGSDAPAPSAANDSFTVPPAPASLGYVDTAPVPTALAFADHYKTNSKTTNTVDTNAGIRLLSGFSALWTSGASWDSGSATTLGAAALQQNIAYVATRTQTRTAAEAEMAYFDDRRALNYAVLDGLGPLMPAYLAGSGAFTSLTSIPADAATVKASDKGNGGKADSSLGKIAELIGKLRNDYSSSEPSKGYFQYPRPWRWSNEVIVVPELESSKGTDAAKDGGFPSGHTNGAFLTALTHAYAIPERYQEMLTRASELGENRIVAGMHSPFDVMGGRVLATALAAAILSDPEHAALKAAAYEQAHSYLSAQTGSSLDNLNAFAHSADLANDRFADHANNRANFLRRMSYGFTQLADTKVTMKVPKNAEVLLETRLPYLDATQRRVVLNTTGLASGYPLLDDAEGWGRLNLFAAADGYGAFYGDVVVTMDASKGGFHAADTWRNDIAGTGMLRKEGSGALSLSGENRYSGGTYLLGGRLTAASAKALGQGDVYVAGGTLLNAAAAKLQIGGQYTQRAGATLAVEVGKDGRGQLQIASTATLDGGTLEVKFAEGYKPVVGETLTLITAGKRQGKFSTIKVTGYTLTPIYTATQVLLRIDA